MATNSLISIAMADDHRLFLDGLFRLFDGIPDMTVVGSAANGADAVKMVSKHQPDILLLDIDMPDMNGFTVADRLRAIDMHPRIILLTMHDDPPYLLAASRPDIQGFVLKDAAFDELIEAIRQIHKGGRYTSPSATMHSLTHSLLSPREQRVLECAAQGLTTQQTADYLDIHVKTVETHRSHILRKLQASNITEAVHRMDLIR